MARHRRLLQGKYKPHWRFIMHIRTLLATAFTALSLVTVTGCAVTRGQETVGAYVDDAAITAQIKGRFIETNRWTRPQSASRRSMAR